MDNQLNLESNSSDLKALCVYAFDTLISIYKPDHKFQFPKQFKSHQYPLFVTWTTGKSRELRGCIGTFVSGELETQLPRFALVSALKDSRFDPISQKEIPSLNVEISLLLNFKKAKSALDWEIGKHGIEIKYNSHTATFLPEVAKEQKWDKHTTLQHLLLKAGVYEKVNDIIDQIELTTYESITAEISYKEYLHYNNK